jgi:aquaporin Z
MECVNCVTVDKQPILLFYSMRAMNIRVSAGNTAMARSQASFKKNRKHYLQEALGLAIFMISACFFSALLEGKNSALYQAIPNGMIRLLMMGLLMGLTALFIFYSPITAPSGSHINPAVTLVFLRLGKICPVDAFFYILFQLAGGLAAVYAMAFLMGNLLTDEPVHYAITVPGKFGVAAAAFTELVIAFIMISMVLFTSDSERLKKATRPIAGILVCLNVFFAGPVSGFGMNPARTLASAIPANEYTAIWIYMIIPIIGMLAAAEFFLLIKKRRNPGTNRQIIREYLMNKTLSK